MKIIVSAGGTGGHIYPALAIIDKFKEHEKNLEVLYIGTHNRMEKDLIPKRNIKYEELEIYGFSKTDIIRDIKNIFLINKAYKKSLKIMKEFKPDLVLGIGGYVTYPVIKAASKLNIKTFIHEQNSIAGKSNRSLAKYADLIGVSFPESIKYFPQNKTFVSGNPVADNALKIKPISKESIGLDPNKKLVIIVCGSLGSLSVNQKMSDFVESVNGKSYQVLYITGNDLYESFISQTKVSKNVIVKPYIDNLSALLKNADLVVTRAGASTMSEIIALCLPAIFIPSPYVANNHQYYNAMELKKKNAGEVIEEKDLNANTLLKMIDSLIDNDQKLNTIRNNLRTMKVQESSELIYKKLKDLIK
ncbi:MAG: undecaprenyldiphospho-muramoylpentapeptide beta-N-acetylglucosaminyltransferase [Bacilli bacterium]